MTILYKASEVAKKLISLRNKEMSALKLRALLFYCQAWSLVWDDVPMFEGDIEINKGYSPIPIIDEVKEIFNKKFLMTKNDFSEIKDRSFLKEHVKTMKQIVKAYGENSLQDLSDKIRLETFGIFSYEKDLNYYKHEYLKHFYTLQYYSRIHKNTGCT